MDGSATAADRSGSSRLQTGNRQTETVNVADDEKPVLDLRSTTPVNMAIRNGHSGIKDLQYLIAIIQYRYQHQQQKKQTVN